MALNRNLLYRRLFLALASLMSATTSHAIVNGIQADSSSLSPAIRATADSVIQLRVGRGSATPCTGVHIGEGYVLTARHCIEGARDVGLYSNPIGKPFVDLSSMATPHQYGSVPVSPANFTYNNTRIPDLVIIVAVDEQLIEKYRSLPRVKLPSRTYSVSDFESFYVWGYGRSTEIDAPELARLQLEPFSETLKHYQASTQLANGAEYLWGARTSTQSAHTAPGDSGGPLIGITKEGEAILLGLTFANPNELQKETIAQAQTQISIFTRLDHPYVLQTLAPIRDGLEKLLLSQPTCRTPFL